MAEDQPPDFLLLKYVLNPEDYGLENLPIPLAGGSCLAAIEAFSTAPVASDDDIPF